MSQRYSIHLAEEALPDLRSIHRYVACVLKERQTANLLLRRIKVAISELDHMPERIKLMDDEPFHGAGLRKMIIGNYAVFFAIRNQQVCVLRVMYGGMDYAQQIHS